jgi:TonB family protein
LRKLIPIVLFVCASAWAQSGPPSAQDSGSKAQTSESPQTAPDSDKKPEPDQIPAAPAADSKNLEPIKIQKASYPYAAQDQAIQGEVIVKVLVSETGDVESAEVVSGDPVLAKSAVDAAKKWKFKPFIKNGRPVKIWANIPFDFAFSNKIMEKGVAADGSATSDSGSGSRPPSSDSSSPAAGSAPPSATTPQRVRVSSGVSHGLLIRQIAPVYPQEARQNRIQGTVLLHAVISKEGRITDLRLISGRKELAPAAIGAVQQWRYKPYLLMGNPVEVDTEIQVNFQLR